MIRMAGTSSPIIEYNSGRLELLQAKHQMMEKMIDIMMIRVPIPIPMTKVEVDWHKVH